MQCVTATAVYIADDSQTYLRGYHFVKMLNRPVDLPLRFIIVSVTESLTFRGEIKFKQSWAETFQI